MPARPQPAVRAAAADWGRRLRELTALNLPFLVAQKDLGVTG